MEDPSAKQDRTVRNSIGDVVQFMYGNDGLDATYLVRENIRFVAPSVFEWEHAPPDEIENIIDIMKEIKRDVIFYSPINIERVLEFELQKSHDDIVSPQYVFNKIQKMCNSWSLYSTNTKHNNLTQAFDCTAFWKLRALIYTSLCSKVICKNKKCSTSTFERVLSKINIKVIKSFVQNGEMVGVVSAQSLGQPVTQLTLNTFHAAGISSKNVTLGVPRFRELINVAKTIKSPSMQIYTTKTLNSDQLDKLASKLENLIFGTIVTKSLIFDTTLKTYTYFQMPDDNEDSSYYQYGITYELCQSRLKEKRVNVVKLTVQLMSEYTSIKCIATSYNTIDVLVQDDSEFSMETIRLLNSKLKTLKVSGYESIQKVYINQDGYLDTDGTCLQNILSNPLFDGRKCLSNNILEIKELLGIEAARNVLLQEIRKVIEFDGTYVNMRHFQILVDTMTHKGNLMAVTRHGINRSENGPLMKCSFEETVDVLTDAAVFSEIDLLRGVTENITVGKLANVGTGTGDIQYE
jgi:DNA-directed RNA polymerase II subunit RPB1